jgi:23S rRNA (guanosine2251-2'-O)-methyltransferase
MFITGYHAIEETLRRGDGDVLFVSKRNRRIDALAAQAQRAGVPVHTVGTPELDRLCGPGHQGAALACPRAAGESREPVGRGLASAARGQTHLRGQAHLREAVARLTGSNLLILFLDELQDPQNLGAILRSADQLAVDLVVTTARRSASETQAVLRSSAGASVHTAPLAVANLVQAMQACKEAGFWVYGADIHGRRVEQVRFEGRVGLVMGSEGSGLRRLVKESCDELVRIPARGHVDSFNVSVAAGIMMYEVRRQQGFPGFQ